MTTESSRGWMIALKDCVEESLEQKPEGYQHFGEWPRKQQ